MLHQVSHSNSKTTINAPRKANKFNRTSRDNADRKDSSGNRDNADLKGNKGSRIVIEAIDKKLALLFVKQGGSSVSAALLNGVAFFFARKKSRTPGHDACYRMFAPPLDEFGISFDIIRNYRLIIFNAHNVFIIRSVIFEFQNSTAGFGC